MPSGVTGVTGVTGLPAWGPDEATAPERLGGPADPRHNEPGEIHPRYAWLDDPSLPHGPYGVENGLLGFEPILYTEPADVLGDNPRADLQPLTRAAPWPKGVSQSEEPADVLPRLEQTNRARGVSFGAPRAQWLAMPAVQDEWLEYDVDGPGDSMQVPIPDQIKPGGGGGYGNRDRAQSNAPQNSYGFGGRHGHRRVAAGSIPGNYDWMVPGSRPLMPTRVGGGIVPVGVDSPFYGQVAGDAWTAEGAELRDLPAAYAASPQPAQAATLEATPVPDIGFW